MERPRRKKLRLQGHDYSQHGAYFITICTHNKKPLLAYVVGGDDHIAPQTRLSEYGLVVERYLQGIRGIDQYVIMPNHVHIIVVIEPEGSGPMWSSAPTSVSHRIRSFNTLVTKELGRKIWQRSYYDHVVRDESDYLRIASYIMENPAKWMEDRYYVPEQ